MSFKNKPGNIIIYGGLVLLILAILVITSMAMSYQPESVNKTATASQIKIDYQTQMLIFDDIWKIIDEDYLYRSSQKEILELLKNTYKNKLNARVTMRTFYELMYEMILNLGDNHSILTPPGAEREYICLPDGYLPGSGAYLVPIPGKHLVKVIDVLPGSPADEAGLQEHDSIVKINGLSALDNNNHISCIRINQTVELSIQRPKDNSTKKITLTPINEILPYPVFWMEANTKDGKKVGYIRLLGFDKQTPQLVQLSLAKVNQLPNLIGLIIDVRANAGGINEYLQSALSFFTTGNHGYHLSQSKNFPATLPFDVPPLQNLYNSSTIPLVILVSSETKSDGELFAGVLQNSGRAYIIGEKTAGHVEALLFYSLRDGSTLGLSVYKFIPNHSDVSSISTGVIPDQIIPIDWELFRTLNDPAIKAGIEYFEKLSGKD